MLTALGALIFASRFVLVAVAARAQQELPEPPPLETPASPNLPDPLLPQIAATVQGVTARDIAALAKALNVDLLPAGATAGSSRNTLKPIGDLDGDGVPELLLKWAVPVATPGVAVAPLPDSGALWSVYLLSWDGAHWKASRLVTGVAEYEPAVVNLGAAVGRALVLILPDRDSQFLYPAVFAIEGHAAALLWDSQSEASRYQPLLGCEVSFRNAGRGPAEMLVTGRANPGLLEVEPRGHRGFRTRAVYRWDGKAFIPVKTVYVLNADYTIYRFIAALHLHDYSAAYALVAPAKFLQTDSPTLDAFRKYIEDNFSEFLGDGIFEAPEPPAGSPDSHIFVLTKSDARNTYHPAFSDDGKFLLTGLTRTHEAPD